MGFKLLILRLIRLKALLIIILYTTITFGNGEDLKDTKVSKNIGVGIVKELKFISYDKNKNKIIINAKEAKSDILAESSEDINYYLTDVNLEYLINPPLTIEAKVASLSQSNIYLSNGVVVNSGHITFKSNSMNINTLDISISSKDNIKLEFKKGFIEGKNFKIYDNYNKVEIKENVKAVFEITNN